MIVDNRRLAHAFVSVFHQPIQTVGAPSFSARFWRKGWETQHLILRRAVASPQAQSVEVIDSFGVQNSGENGRP